MKIQTIYIATYRYDLPFTRACVASIREFYPDISIKLIKDYFYGAFDTREIERTFGIGVFETEYKVFGWGFSKLEPLFQEDQERYLILDSDIVFAGKVLDLLDAHEESFIVDYEAVTDAFVESHYFSSDLLARIDPDFAFPGYTFNTGQMVGTSGIFKRSDFEGLVYWEQGQPPQLSDPSVFKLGEQGLINYFLMKQAALGRISLKRLNFMEVGDTRKPIAMGRLMEGQGYPFLIHWCGLRCESFDEMINGSILKHFSNKYYEKIPFGRLKQWIRPLAFQYYQSIKRNIKAVLKRPL